MIDPQNPILVSYGIELQPSNYLLHVGTYDKDGIGESCYHTNLAIFESLLSHTYLRENEWLVAEMVAGTDAFAALNIPEDTLVEWLENDVKFCPDKPVILVCPFGRRSKRAAAMMKRVGYDAYSLKGGILAWQDDGYPVHNHLT